MPFNLPKISLFILLALTSLFIFTRNISLHGLEFRDDEVFYFKSTQEMVKEGNYLSPTYFGEDRFQKPILFYWFIVVFYKLFGINWFAARFVSAIFGALSVVCTWQLARRLFNIRIAHLSALILTTIPLFFKHAKNAVPDMALNFFIVLALYVAYEFLQNPQKKIYRYIFFASCALGFMVKGIAALAVPLAALIFYSLVSNKRKELIKFNFVLGLLIFLVVVSPWFVYMMSLHGKEYMDYMLVKETQSRIVGQGGIGSIFATLADHAMYYPKIILNYFAPWSAFFFVGFFLCIVRVFKKGPEADSLKFLCVWIGVVYLIFSSMKFLINHYMLVLTTPFAILVSYFFLTEIKSASWLHHLVLFFRKWMAVAVFTILFIGISFLVLFLLKAHYIWGMIIGVLFVLGFTVLITTKKVTIRPWILGLCILFLFTQSQLLLKADVISHAPLQKFAKTILDQPKPYVIGVGSHDIHDLEFQVYFDQPVEKAATSLEDQTHGMLNKLFKNSSEVYCLFIKKDYDSYISTIDFRDQLEVIQTELIMRRRMNLDKGFLRALVAFNRDVIEEYLKEEIILVKKVQNEL